jgi:hypothetical protein
MDNNQRYSLVASHDGKFCRSSPVLTKANEGNGTTNHESGIPPVR